MDVHARLEFRMWGGGEKNYLIWDVYSTPASSSPVSVSLLNIHRKISDYIHGT
jgi:hypothetical protein